MISLGNVIDFRSSTSVASGGGTTDLTAIVAQLTAIQNSMATKGDVYAASML